MTVGAIAPAVAPGGTHSVAPASPPMPPDAVTAGNALPPDTDQRHYYAGAGGGPLGLRLYAGPAGMVDSQGWQPRDSTLGAPHVGSAIGPMAVSPARVPFSLQATSGGGTTAQAQFTNEDGVSLGIDQIAGSGVVGATTAPAIPIPRPGLPASLSLHPTISGLDARFTLATSQQANASLALALALDPGTRLDTLDSGLLRVSRDITESPPNGGEPVVVTQAEYLLGHATATDSSPAPAALVQGAPPSALAQARRGM
jgi:hypothetical protein